MFFKQFWNTVTVFYFGVFLFALLLFNSGIFAVFAFQIALISFVVGFVRVFIPAFLCVFFFAIFHFLNFFAAKFKLTLLWISKQRTEKNEKPQTNNGTKLHKSQNIRKISTLHNGVLWLFWSSSHLPCNIRVFSFFGSWVLATYFIFPHSTITWLPLFLIVGRAVAAIQTKILDNV